MIKNGTFTSVWDSSIDITTIGELNLETGKIFDVEQVDINDVDILTDEYFTDNEGNKYQVCTECHEYILNEHNKCTNPNCDNQ